MATTTYKPWEQYRWNGDPFPLLDAVDAVAAVLEEAGYTPTADIRVDWGDAEASYSSVAEARDPLRTSKPVVSMWADALCEPPSMEPVDQYPSVHIYAVEGERKWARLRRASHLSLGARGLDHDVVQRLMATARPHLRRVDRKLGLKSRLYAAEATKWQRAAGWVDRHSVVLGLVFGCVAAIAAVVGLFLA